MNGRAISSASSAIITFGTAVVAGAATEGGAAVSVSVVAPRDPHAVSASAATHAIFIGRLPSKDPTRILHASRNPARTARPRAEWASHDAPPVAHRRGAVRARDRAGGRVPARSV